MHDYYYYFFPFFLRMHTLQHSGIFYCYIPVIPPPNLPTLDVYIVIFQFY